MYVTSHFTFIPNTVHVIGQKRMERQFLSLRSVVAKTCLGILLYTILYYIPPLVPITNDTTNCTLYTIMYNKQVLISYSELLLWLLLELRDWSLRCTYGNCTVCSVPYIYIHVYIYYVYVYHTILIKIKLRPTLYTKNCDNCMYLYYS